MAKYNIYGHVLYSEIEYERLMHKTERIFINSLMSRLPDIKEWTDDIWHNIDHEYMIQTLEEIKRDVVSSDIATVLKYKNTAIDIEEMIEATDKLVNLYDINPINKFQRVERAFGNKVSKAYKKRVEFIDRNEYLDETEYLTQQIKNFNKIEQTIPYFNKAGQIVRTVTPSTYLSMLYNVNLTRTGWNQTFKDADYFENDLVLLETHPHSCDLCAPMQGKVYSRTGKSKRYPSIEVAYENGVGHPNCKCEFSIYWDSMQLDNQYISQTQPGEYEIDQKQKAIEREIRKYENEMSLFRMIGNQSEADKTAQRIEILASKL